MLRRQQPFLLAAQAGVAKDGVAAAAAAALGGCGFTMNARGKKFHVQKGKGFHTTRLHLSLSEDRGSKKR